MFSALICLNFLPWSILNLKEKSRRVILAEFNSFPSHVLNKHTGLEDPSLSKCGHAGRHSSKEILTIGMFRSPFSCGYYQYTENIHLARTKTILSCLFLLRLMDLNCIIGLLESSIMGTHAYNMTYLLATCSGKRENIAGYTNNSLFAQHRKHCCNIVCWIIINP